MDIGPRYPKISIGRTPAVATSNSKGYTFTFTKSGPYLQNPMSITMLIALYANQGKVIPQKVTEES